VDHSPLKLGMAVGKLKLGSICKSVLPLSMWKFGACNSKSKMYVAYVFRQCCMV